MVGFEVITANGKNIVLNLNGAHQKTDYLFAKFINNHIQIKNSCKIDAIFCCQVPFVLFTIKF